MCFEQSSVEQDRDNEIIALQNEITNLKIQMKSIELKTAKRARKRILTDRAKGIKPYDSLVNFVAEIANRSNGG